MEVLLVLLGIRVVVSMSTVSMTVDGLDRISRVVVSMSTVSMTVDGLYWVSRVVVTVSTITFTVDGLSWLRVVLVMISVKASEVLRVGGVVPCLVAVSML